MKKWIAFILCAAMLLSLCGCAEKEAAAPTAGSETTAPSEETQATVDHKNVYAAAAEKTQQKQDLVLQIVWEEEKKVGLDTFREKTIHILRLQNAGTPQLKAKVSTKSDLGRKGTTSEQIYIDGNVYVRVRNNIYTAKATAEEFMAQFMPAAALDSANYGECTENADGSLHFAAPKNLEPWTGAQLEEGSTAEADVTLSAAGEIQKTVYRAAFRRGAADVTLKATAEISDEAPEAVEAPGNKADYRQLEDWQAPLLLRRAVALLEQAKAVTAQGSETVSVAALKFNYLIQWETHMFPDAKGLMYHGENQGTAQDTHKTEKIDYRETIREGTLTVEDSGKTEKIEDIPDELILGAVRKQIMDPICFDTAKMDSLTRETVGDTVLIRCGLSTGKEESQSILERFFGDGQLLEKHATSYTTDYFRATLGIDRATGLPTGVTRSYQGRHVIEGQTASIAGSNNYTIRLGSGDSYEHITGQLLNEKAPEAAATPLFYRVTSPEGKEMWLLGTIHAGDGRTAYLPKEIYDALKASDALAVEFDLLAFEEAAEKDPEAAAAPLQHMIYRDGTTVKSHITDRKLLEKAEALLLAGGCYQPMLPFMKPTVWEQTIGQFFLETGGRLTAQRGVDRMLLSLAHGSNQKIIDLESAESQSAMLGGFSDALQEKILKEITETGSAAYNREVEALFELWCRGDEKALTDAIRGDGETDEEWQDKISHERNREMLKKCQQFLEGDQTVFVAVGLAHLLEEETGLLEALRAAGYRAEQVSFS